MCIQTNAHSLIQYFCYFEAHSRHRCIHEIRTVSNEKPNEFYKNNTVFILKCPAKSSLNLFCVHVDNMPKTQLHFNQSINSNIANWLAKYDKKNKCSDKRKFHSKAAFSVRCTLYMNERRRKTKTNHQSQTKQMDKFIILI